MKNILKSIGSFSLLLFAGFIVLLFVGVLALHLNDELNWRSNFNGVQTFSDRCSYAVNQWPGSFESALQETHALRPMTMPYRGQENPPRTYPGQYLYTECTVKVEGAPSVGLVTMRVGIVYGESIVYLNAQPVAATKSGDVIELPIPPALNAGEIKLSIISKGEEDGAVGLATLKPPLFVAVDVAGQKLASRWLSSVYTEQTMLRMGATSVLLCFFFALWFFGLRYGDIQWIMSCAGCIFLSNLLQYGFQFNFSFDALLERWQAVSYLGIGFSLFMFLTRFTRVHFKHAILSLMLGIAFVAGSTFLVLCDSATFFEFRLLVFTPTLINASLLTVLSIYFIYILLWQKVVHDSQRRRLIYGLRLSLLTAALLFIQVYLDERRGLYIHSIAYFAVLSSFALTLIFDLALRQREYFKERHMRISEQRRNAEAKAIADTAKYIAHDFQKPFAIVKRFVENLQQTPVSEVAGFVQQFRDSIAAAEHDAKQLIDDLTSFSPDQALLLSDINLHGLFDEANKLVLAGKGITFSNQIPASLDVSAERRSLLRVVQNILLNAVEAMPASGTITVFVGAETADSLTFVIRNTGSEVRPEDLQRIFDVSYTSGKEHGKGLGLAYAKQVVTKHGGDIWCESGRGYTEFHLSLPRSPKDSLDLTPILNVALVDDDDFVHMAWRLEAKGIRIHSFNDPAQFLVEVESKAGLVQSFDAILLDQNFRGHKLDGIGVAKTLKSLGKCPPVFLISFATLHDESASKYFDVLMSKEPCDAKALRSHIAKTKISESA